jgi:ribosomal protein S11
MRNISIDQEVVYVAAPASPGGQPSFKKGKITEVITQGAARIELSENNHAIAAYSATGEPGTFHFADQTSAVKDAQKTQPAAAAPAASK